MAENSVEGGSVERRGEPSEPEDLDSCTGMGVLLADRASRISNASFAGSPFFEKCMNMISGESPMMYCPGPWARFGSNESQPGHLLNVMQERQFPHTMSRSNERATMSCWLSGLDTSQ